MKRVAGSLLGFLCLALCAQGCGVGALITFAAIDASKSKTGDTLAVPAPLLASVSPNSGSHGGGQSVTITGSEFPSDATVSVGGVAASSVTVQSSTQLQAVLAPVNAIGPADVVVTNPKGGAGTLAGGYTFTNTTSVVAFLPVAGPVSGNVVFSLTLTDPESDPVDLVLEYDAGAGFQPIPAGLILSGGLSGLTSSPSGVTHNLTWDSVGSLGTTNATGVVLRATPADTVDGVPGVPATSAPFDVQNNTPVDLQFVQPGDDAFNVQLSYRVFESDPGDTVTITRLEYRDVSSGQTGSLSVLAGRQASEVVAASPTGVMHQTLWDSLADLGRGNNRLVEVTVEVSDGTAVASRTSAPFFVSNGPVRDQLVVDAGGLDVHGFAVGDVRGGDGLRDLVFVDTRIDGNGQQRNQGGSLAVARNRRLGFDAASVIDFGGPSPLLLNGHTNNPVYAAAPLVDPDGGGSLPTYPNYIASNAFHPAEVATLDADGDGDVDVVLAHSPHAPYTQPPLDLAANIASVLANVGQDINPASPFFSGGANTLAHQQTFLVPQAGGALDPAAGTWAPSWADRARVGRLLFGAQSPIAGGVAFPSQVGFFTQDLLVAELDAGEGGGADLIHVQGVGDVENALGSSDVRGLLVVRKRGPGGLAPGASNTYLDQSAMGALPVHAAVADLTAEAHDGVSFNPHPLSGQPNTFPLPAPGTGPSLPAGTPDILVANTGDNSLTFYLHTGSATSYGGDPNVDPPEYYGQRLELQPLVTTLTAALAGSPTTLPAGDLAAVAIGDLNGDGKNDFVTVHRRSRLLLVFVYDPTSAGPLSLNQNQAGFGLPQSYSPAVLPPLVLPFRLAGFYTLPGLQVGRPQIVDLTGDGQGEIVVPMGLNNEVVLFEPLGPAHSPRAAFGEGVGGTPDFGGAFDPAADLLPAQPPAARNPTPFTSEFTPYAVEVADLDADGREDVVAAAGLSFDASVFYQLAQGTLDRFVPVPVSGSPFILGAGNVQGTPGLGLRDEVVVNLPNQNSVQVFSRDPAQLLAPVRTFDLTATTFPRPSLPFVFHLAEVSGDNFDDVVTATELFQIDAVTIQGGAVVLPGAASLAGVSPSFQAASGYGPIGFSANGGDLDADGLPDIVLANNQGATGLTLFPGVSAPGTYDAAGAVRYSIGSLTDVWVLDLDGDGRRDVICGTPDAAIGLKILWGTGTIPAPAPDPFVGLPTPTLGPPIGLYIQDLDGNGLADIVVTGFIQSSGGILFQTAPRSFSAQPLVVGGEPGEAAVGDLDGDGRVDIALPWGSENLLAIYYQRPPPAPPGSFLGPATFSTAATPVGCVILDVDADGKNDVVVSARGANALNVFLQR